MSMPPPPPGLTRVAAVALAFAGLCGTGGVLLGAYAAHGGPDEMKEALSFASLHALVHGLALAAAALVHDRVLASRFSRWMLRVALLCFALGVIMFSGDIYLRVFAIYLGTAPHGGTAFLLGWLCLTLGGTMEIFRRRGP
ncbi:MAG TPA: DUF423 domain-containing protein [Alphaproteobacteria bacterium]|nr:DUF423 domain-containing protein [Alphaproteobacteria bacterium]